MQVAQDHYDVIYEDPIYGSFHILTDFPVERSLAEDIKQDAISTGLYKSDNLFLSKISKY